MSTSLFQSCVLLFAMDRKFKADLRSRTSRKCDTMKDIEPLESEMPSFVHAPDNGQYGMAQRCLVLRWKF